MGRVRPRAQRPEEGGAAARRTGRRSRLPRPRHQLPQRPGGAADGERPAAVGPDGVARRRGGGAVRARRGGVRGGPGRLQHGWGDRHQLPLRVTTGRVGRRCRSRLAGTRPRRGHRPGCPAAGHPPRRSGAPTRDRGRQDLDHVAVRDRLGRRGLRRARRGAGGPRPGRPRDRRRRGATRDERGLRCGPPRSRHAADLPRCRARPRVERRAGPLRAGGAGLPRTGLGTGSGRPSRAAA